MGLSFELLQDTRRRGLYTATVIILRCPFTAYVSQTEASQRFWTEKKLVEIKEETFLSWARMMRSGLRCICENSRSQHVRVVSYERFTRHVETELSRIMAVIPEPLEPRQLTLTPAGFYLEDERLMGILSKAPVVVMQSMSGRSVSAGVFETMANNGVLRFRSGPREGQQHMALNAYGLLRKEAGEDAYLEQVRHVQARWVELYREMSERIPGRKVFLWLSEHAPGKNVRLDQGDLGHFPHFVTHEMVESLRDAGFEIVDGTYGYTAPQVLRSDTTGVIEDVFDRRNFPGRREGTQSLNTYYAPPAAHRIAAMALVRHFLGDSGRKGSQ